MQLLSKLTPFAGVASGVVLGILLEKWWQEYRKKDPRKAAQASSRDVVRSASSRDVVRSGSNIHVPIAQLEAATAACIQAAGAPEDRAALVAEVLVAADRRGVPSHGVNRAEMYCSELKSGLIDPKATPTISAETASTANVDGQNTLGAVVSKFAMEVCIKKAKATGVGVVVCHNSNHFGIAGYWCQKALDQGLIGFAFTNTSPFMVPTRGRTRAAGTNPIACYCPGGSGDSFQLDMATTTVPVGKVEVCHRKGQTLPHGWAVDDAGCITTDAYVTLARGGLTPVGGPEETAGYKGYGLNMMVEILCAVLSGCGVVGPDVLPWRADRPGKVDYGHCFFCIDPAQLLPGGQFESTLAGYLKRMRGLPAADPDLPVMVPGDPEKAQEAASKHDGVALSEAIALGFRALARDLGCPEKLPAEIQAMPEKEAPKHVLATKQD